MGSQAHNTTSSNSALSFEVFISHQVDKTCPNLVSTELRVCVCVCVCVCMSLKDIMLFRLQNFGSRTCFNVCMCVCVCVCVCVCLLVCGVGVVAVGGCCCVCVVV